MKKRTKIGKIVGKVAQVESEREDKNLEGRAKGDKGRRTKEEIARQPGVADSLFLMLVTQNWPPKTTTIWSTSKTRLRQGWSGKFNKTANRFGHGAAGRGQKQSEVRRKQPGNEADRSVERRRGEGVGWRRVGGRGDRRRIQPRKGTRPVHGYREELEKEKRPIEEKARRKGTRKMG